MAKKQKKQELRFDANITCGEVHKIASRICNERINQMAKDLVDAYININHADHIRNNEVVYEKLMNRVKKRMTIGFEEANAIYVNVINADYDIRNGNGNGYYV